MRNYNPSKIHMLVKGDSFVSTTHYFEDLTTTIRYTCLEEDATRGFKHRHVKFMQREKARALWVQLKAEGCRVKENIYNKTFGG